MSSTEAVTSSVQDRVLTLTLNRPDQMNALSTAILEGLRDHIARAGKDPEVRVVAITGSGAAFCAGADLREAGALLGAGGDEFAQWLGLWRETFDSFEACSKPVVAVLNGATLAGGLELALACDLMLAAQSARLGDVHARFGLVPGGGGSQRLVDAIGTRNARWLMYSGRQISAQRAFDLGLVQEVLPDEGYLADAQELLAELARRSEPSTAFMKRLSRSGAVTTEGLDREILEAAIVVAGEDAKEGLAAFVERREPKFR